MGMLDTVMVFYSRMELVIAAVLYSRWVSKFGQVEIKKLRQRGRLSSPKQMYFANGYMHVYMNKQNIVQHNTVERTL